MSEIKPETSGDSKCSHPKGTTKVNRRVWTNLINKTWFPGLLRDCSCWLPAQSGGVSQMAHIQNVEKMVPSYYLIGKSLNFNC